MDALDEYIRRREVNSLTLMAIGTIRALYRYPVKSFAGESVQASVIERYGLYGDRSHAFVDETKEGWDSFYTARKLPKMLGYKAKLVGEYSGVQTPEISIEAPDGRLFQWNEALLEEIQPYAKQKLSMKSYDPQSSELMGVDAASILIITNTTLLQLEELWGKKLDHRRFRANVVVTLDDDSQDEGNWIGKRLIMGNTELQVDEYCERCSMITIDPDTLERDSSLIKKVNEEMNLRFGMYAAVIQPGEVKIGDRLYLAE